MRMGSMTTRQIRQYVREGKADRVPPEDLRIFLENEKARANGFENVQGIRELYASICEKAVHDYKAAMDGKGCDHSRAKTVLRDVGSFFDSDFFLMVSGARNGDIVRGEIQKRKEEKKK